MMNQTPTPSYTGPIFYVRSSRPSRFFAVTVNPATDLYRCECADHLYRARDCKHIRAAQQGTVKPATRKAPSPQPSPARGEGGYSPFTTPDDGVTRAGRVRS